MRPARAPWQPEHIDLEGHDPAILAQSLRHVEQANDWFGGTRSLRRALTPLLDRRTGSTILDVGTGSGGIARRLLGWADRRGTPVRVTGLDRHGGALEVARLAAARREAPPSLPLVRADTLALPFRDRTFDIVTATLLLHHLPDSLLVPALREMARVARAAVIIAELERSWIHHAGARLLAATLWRWNPLTRHDGPVSVLRGFTPNELRGIAETAGLTARCSRHPFFRLVLVASPAASGRAKGTVRA